MILRRLAAPLGSVTLTLLVAAGSGFSCDPTPVPAWAGGEANAADEKDDEDADDETPSRGSSSKSGQTEDRDGERRDGGASTSSPSASDAGATPDAAPSGPTTFQIGGNGCDGARCGGGSGGRKASDAMPTADKLCRDRGFARASDFTIVDEEPGGRFCTWRGTAWGCDPSCSSCNPIASATCVSP